MRVFLVQSTSDALFAKLPPLPKDSKDMEQWENDPQVIAWMKALDNEDKEEISSAA